LLTPTPTIIEEILSIPLPSPLSLGEQTTIKINYQYTYHEDIFNKQGFFLYFQDENAGILEIIAYTVNSPEYARF